MKIDLFGDKIGSVEYISHNGSDLTVVNAARVSFGSEKEILDENSLTTLCLITIVALSSIVVLRSASWFLSL